MPGVLIVPVLGIPAHEILAHDGHPLVGRHLDAGSYGLLSDGDLDAVLGAELEAAARAASVEISRQYHRAIATRGLLIAASGAVPALWEDCLARGDCLSLLCSAEPGAEVAWSLTGYRLPSFARLPPAPRQDLWATWFTLCGGPPGPGRYLLREPEAALDAAADAALTERLQRLYGE